MSDFSLAGMTRPHVKAGPREWLGLAVLALPTLLLAMDATVLYLAVPSLTAELRPSAAQLLWITDVYGYVGQGPIMALGTEMVVGAAAPEKAGSASALSETSIEFGLAFGVAVLGTVGMFVNRQAGFTTGMAVVAGIGAVITLGLAVLTRIAAGSGSATDRSPA